MEDNKYKSEHPVTVTNAPFYDRATLNQKVKGLLASEPELTVIDLIWYHCFARQVYKLVRSKLSVAELRTKVKELVAKWKAKGLIERVMNRILEDLFCLGWLLKEQHD